MRAWSSALAPLKAFDGLDVLPKHLQRVHAGAGAAHVRVGEHELQRGGGGGLRAAGDELLQLRRGAGEHAARDRAHRDHAHAQLARALDGRRVLRGRACCRGW